MLLSVQWQVGAVLCSVFSVVEPVYELHFARYYGNHMVLQRAPSRAVIWGYGPFISDNTSIAVTVDNNATRRVVYHTTVKNRGCSLTCQPLFVIGLPITIRIDDIYTSVSYFLYLSSKDDLYLTLIDMHRVISFTFQIQLIQHVLKSVIGYPVVQCSGWDQIVDYCFTVFTLWLVSWRSFPETG